MVHGFKAFDTVKNGDICWLNHYYIIMSEIQEHDETLRIKAMFMLLLLFCSMKSNMKSDQFKKDSAE